ncbi:hypothetical protein [Streptomyces bambusae]|uniref:Baseplate protein J-like domain-containing protein n=1 Tax=Streptomyces bambusae TaxID=1550616 RepID=A0ABS6Z618_9ACTN|nr:hypothetical protein [Streptomyces bambusae]MBW5483182.1 hypothetical protein [Streptomyces bambusae]
MSRLQRIQWVVLPAGLSSDGTTARISVFVAPRLDADGPTTLDRFPDFLDWPARLATALFFLSETDAEGRPSGTETGPLDRAGPAPDSGLWSRLFTGDTPVTPFGFDDFRSTVKVSYPAKQLAQDTRKAFAEVAAEFPEKLPAATDMSQRVGFAAPTGMLARLADIGTALEEADRAIELDPDGSAEPVLGSHDAFLAFHQHERSVTEGARATRTAPPARPTPPTVDFHQVLSVLGDHPTLLRRLGLVVDLTVPADRIAEARGTRGLALAPRFASLLPDAATEDLTPATRYVLDAGDAFCAASAGADPLGPPARGLLALPEDDYSIEQADIDGINLKLVAAARVSAAADGIIPGDSRALQATPPTLRTTGIALVRSGRARTLQADFRRAEREEQALRSGSPLPLTAEDLVRGYRIDVFDGTRQRWFSLHERVVHYRAPDGGGPLTESVTDEGFFQTALAEPEGPVARVHVHEHVVSWDGWALSAPRPGKALVDEGPGDEESTPEPPGPRRIANRAVTGLPMEIEAEARPGSLPRLRFGRPYGLRVRTVDLAGNGPTLAEAEQLTDQDVLTLPPAGGGETFRRYEAVPAPVLLPRAPYTDGDFAHRMVIRSDAGLTAAQYADTFNADPPADAVAPAPYRPVDERHLVAPKASLECVERHGLLDAAIGSADPAVQRAVYDLAVRENGDLSDPRLPGIAFVDLPATDGRPAQRYVLHTGDAVELPYIPDPLSLGLVLHDLPGRAADDPLEVLWAGPQWHSPRSLLLRLVEGTGPPRFDPASRVLTVALPKAAKATVRISSKASVNERLFGMLHWCRKVLGGGAPFEKVMAAVRVNRHWMVTPWQELTLVHAVQRPLVTPQLNLFDLTLLTRNVGDTHEHLAGQVELDEPSTERIDLLAHWTEQVDDPGEPAPRTEPRTMTTRVFQLPLAEAGRLGPGVDMLNTPSALDGNTLFFSTAAAAAEAQAEGKGTATPEAQEFGDTKHRLVHYEPVATSRFGDCFPPEFAARPELGLLSRTGERVEHVVLSSTKPDPPALLDCLPTLGVESSGSLPDPVVRRRRGGGLRIYLARPWFSSGDGELLAALVTEEGMEPEFGSEPFVTVAGRDPKHRSAPVAFPTAQNFPGAEVVQNGLVLPAPAFLFDGFTVTAAGFAPRFDTGSGRWYCDLDIDLGEAYMPFVRLALARFQPHSLEGEALSPIVHTPVLRTLPERVLTVEGEDPLLITLSGPNYLTQFLVPDVIAVLQRRDPDLADEAVAWTAVEETLVSLETEDTQSPVQTYTAELPLPDPLPPGPLRLLVVESALSGSDFAVSEDFGPLGRQLVYADTVPLR